MQAEQAAAVDTLLHPKMPREFCSLLPFVRQVSGSSIASHGQSIACFSCRIVFCCMSLVQVPCCHDMRLTWARYRIWFSCELMHVWQLTADEAECSNVFLPPPCCTCTYPCAARPVVHGAGARTPDSPRPFLLLSARDRVSCTYAWCRHINEHVTCSQSSARCKAARTSTFPVLTLVRLQIR